MVGILTPLISNNQHTIDWQENIYQNNIGMSISANIFQKATMYQFNCIPALKQFIITVIIGSITCLSNLFWLNLYKL